MKTFILYLKELHETIKETDIYTGKNKHGVHPT